MIQIQGIYKAFDNKVLFENYSLEIPSGDFTIFSGESGCGKTTLLSMIGALEKPDAGKILVNNVNISQRKNQVAFYSSTVGFLFQNFALVEDKTVFDNLSIVKKKNHSEMSMDEALMQVGLLDKKDKKVYTLSGGEQQRIALARLMIKKCELILADEPTGSLDKKNANVVLDILTDMNKRGKTIILVTHDPEIKTRGNRVVEL